MGGCGGAGWRDEARPRRGRWFGLGRGFGRRNRFGAVGAADASGARPETAAPPAGTARARSVENELELLRRGVRDLEKIAAELRSWIKELEASVPDDAGRGRR